MVTVRYIVPVITRRLYFLVLSLVLVRSVGSERQMSVCILYRMNGPWYMFYFPSIVIVVTMFSMTETARSRSSRVRPPLLRDPRISMVILPSMTLSSLL